MLNKAKPTITFSKVLGTYLRKFLGGGYAKNQGCNPNPNPKFR